MIDDPILDGRAGPVRGLMPAKDIIPVVKSDTITFPECRALFVGTAGTATLVMASGKTRTAVPLQAGVNPLRCTQVKDAGTAADIWAMY